MKAEREALKSRQEQTQDALIQANNNFQQMTGRHHQATINLEELQKQQKAKFQQVAEMKNLVDSKQGEFENAQVDYLRKEIMTYEVKNKLDIINQDLTAATQSKQELNAQIQLQMTNLLEQERKSNDLVNEKEKIEKELKQTEEEKKNLENQVQHFNKQLDSQNQTIIDKTKQNGYNFSKFGK